jgi:HPt (histidine-containing phosphotransfer) domain-containing protein
MPDRINALDAQAKRRDWNQLAQTAHQLKGAAGSYGFDGITPYAARLEAALRESRQEDQILSALDELVMVGLCCDAYVAMNSIGDVGCESRPS